MHYKRRPDRTYPMDIIKTLSILLLLLMLVLSFQVSADENISATDSEFQETLTDTGEIVEQNVVANDTGEPVEPEPVEVNSSPPLQNTSPVKIESANKTAPEGNKTNQTGPSAADIQKAFNGWYEKALNASISGNNKAAADAFAAALRLDKGSEKALTGYGEVLSKLGRDTEALEIYSRLQNLSPTNTTILIPLGREQNAVGSHEAALATLLNATAAYPNDTEGWNQLAAAYDGLTRYEEALTTVRRSLQISTDQAGGWGQLGAILSGQGRFYEAIAAFEKSLTLDPKNGITWADLGNTWTALGRYKEAAQAYEAATESRPSDTTLWLKLAAVYEKEQKTKEAAEAYRKGGVISPSDTTNQSVLELNKTETKPDANITVNMTGESTSNSPAHNETSQTKE
nr:tetratricopeptide repeat protein [uncultured Methanospirillum sp.]